MVSDRSSAIGYRVFFCLNPCFNGRWSRTRDHGGNTEGRLVLILVLMEDGLGRPPGNPDFSPLRLNPCFNGRWSRTGKLYFTCGAVSVLILVLMEDGLGHDRTVPGSRLDLRVLILVLMEDGLGQ